MESEHTKQGLSIGVHAAQEVVYAEVGHDDGEEGQHHHQVVSAGTLKGGKRLGVQGNGPDGADEDAHARGWLPSHCGRGSRAAGPQHPC